MENRSSGWELLGGLAIGAVGGFIVGWMMAPRAGGENREAVSDAILDMRERTSDIVETMRVNLEEKLNLFGEALDAGRKAAEYKRAELIDQDEING